MQLRRRFTFAIAVALASVPARRAAAQAAPAEARDDWEEDEELTSDPARLRRPKGDISQVDIQDILAIPVVEAASKRRQSLYEAPAAISTFKPDQFLGASPIDPAEILRRVPGAHVMQTNANNFFVGLRGWNGLVNTHVPVLLDGRRLSEGSLGYPPWGAFPVPLGEVERIEVLRGPGATLYGVDAFSGVISFSSRDPVDMPAVDALVTAGVTDLPLPKGDDRNARLAQLGVGHIGATWKNDDRTLALHGSVGLRFVPEWVEPQANSSTSTQPYYQFGPVGLQTNLGFSAHPDDKTKIRITGSRTLAEVEETVTATGTRATLTAYDDTAGTAWFERRDLGGSGLSVHAQIDGAHQVKTNADHDAAGMKHEGNRTFDNVHGLLQGDWQAWEGRNVLTIGLESSYRKGNVDVEIGGELPVQEPQAVFLGAFLQDEIKLTRKPDLILDVGVRFDQIDAKDPEDGNEATYRTTSPRVSLIFRPAAQQSLRVSAATGFRMPSLFEAFISETVPGFKPPFVVVAANPTLKPESVRSIEAGYRGKPVDWLRLDATVYAQQLRDIIAIVTTNTPVSLQNAIDVDQVGFELGAQMQVGALSGYLSYGFVGHLTNSEARSVPQHIVSLGLDLQLGKHAYVGADAYIMSDYTASLVEVVNSVDVLAQKDQGTQEILNFRLGARVGEHMDVFLNAMNLLAPFKDQADLKQYPSETSHPIGLTALVGARLEGL